MPKSIYLAAKKIQVGHRLPGLDGGYVFETKRSQYAVTIWFHDRDGAENHLTVGPKMPLEVDQREPRPV